MLALVRHAPDEQRKHQEIGMALVRVARRDLDHLRLAAVRVDEGELAKAHAVHRIGHLGKHPEQGLGGQSNGAGVADVLVRLAVVERRQAVAGHLARHALQRLAQHPGADRRVDRHRQVRTVLLDRPDRLQDDRVRLVREIADDGPGQVWEVTLGGNPAVQHYLGSLSASGGRKLALKTCSAVGFALSCTEEATYSIWFVSVGMSTWPRPVSFVREVRIAGRSRLSRSISVLYSVSASRWLSDLIEASDSESISRKARFIARTKPCTAFGFFAISSFETMRP